MSRSSTTTNEEARRSRTHRPSTPGRSSPQDFLSHLERHQHYLAISIGVSPRRINEIVHGNRRITADTALLLARDFGTPHLRLPGRPATTSSSDHPLTQTSTFVPTRRLTQSSSPRSTTGYAGELSRAAVKSWSNDVGLDDVLQDPEPAMPTAAARMLLPVVSFARCHRVA